MWPATELAQLEQRMRPWLTAFFRRLPLALCSGPGLSKEPLQSGNPPPPTKDLGTILPHSLGLAWNHPLPSQPLVEQQVEKTVSGCGAWSLSGGEGLPSETTLWEPKEWTRAGAAISLHCPSTRHGAHTSQ